MMKNNEKQEHSKKVESAVEQSVNFCKCGNGKNCCVLKLPEDVRALFKCSGNCGAHKKEKRTSTK